MECRFDTYDPVASINSKRMQMSKLLRGFVAGAGAWKWGGGCLSTIIIFILLWWILGNFNIFQ
jgi:hypothetical protein